VVGYTNADFTRCSDERKSTSGYVFMLVDGIVSWKSAKQTLVASSIMQAKFVSCYGTAAASQAMVEKLWAFGC